MSASRNINVLLTGNAASLKSTLVAAGNDVETFNRKVESTGQRGSKAMQMWGLAAKAGGLLAAAGFAYSISAAIGFEKRMRNVNSISNLSESNLASLGEQVRAMSTELPQSANELAEGLYDIASSGFQGAEGMEVLRRSAEAASAGLSTTAVSARAITAVLNAYGMGAEEAAHVSNVLFQGVNVGVMSFEELAGTVGDFAGTAAAAGVSIDSATSALATMTLAGISAAEAGTSLNRLLQAMVQPSDELAMIFSQWGFESGEAALSTLGLEGVMSKLQATTGGNITQMLKLFPEIRAARGALALMSAEGKNYANTSKAMAEADEGVGATRKALAEQMKSLSAQFQLFVNWLNATAIAIGIKVLPALNDLLSGAQSVFAAIGNIVSGAADALSGFFDDLASAFGDLFEAGSEVAEALAPVAKILAGMAGGAALVALVAIGKALSFAADMANRFSGVIKGLLIGMAVFRGYDMLNNAVNRLGEGLAALKSKAAGAGGSLKGIAGSIGGAEVAAGAFAIGIMVVAGVLQAIQGESAKAKASVAAFTKELDVDPTNAKSLANAVKEYGEEIEKLNDVANRSNLDNLAQLINPMADNSIQRARAEREGLADAAKKAAREESNLRGNTELLGDEMGLTTEQAEDYARSIGVDLTKDIGKSGDARKEVIDSFKKTRAEAGVTKDAIKSFSQESMEALEEAMKAEAEYLANVSKAATASQDIWAKFGETGATSKELDKFFEDQLASVTKFTENVTKAMQMGLDPAIVSEALLAGPEKAGKLLEDIVADSTGAMVDLVNGGADALQLANSRLLEMARIANKATTAESSQMVVDAGNATKISLMALENGAYSSAQTIADKLKMPIEEVQRIAEEYGIVVDMANGKPFDPKADTTALEQANKTVEEIGESFSTLMQLDPEIGVALDITDPEVKTRRLNELVMGYIRSNPTTSLYFDSLSAEGKIAYVGGLLKDFPGSEGGAPIVALVEATANINPATESLADLERRILQYATADPEASAYLNTHNPTENANYLNGLAMKWASTSPEAAALLDKYQAEVGFGAANGWADAWGRKRTEARIDAKANTSGAEAALNHVARTRLAQLQVQVFSQYGQYYGGGNAMDARRAAGARRGAIHSFSKGGFEQAHVQRTQRVKYAEPETGGEAYIPRLGERNRNLRILGVAAGWNGMALTPMRRGGVLTEGSAVYGRGGGGSTYNTNVQVLIQAPVYGVDQLHQAIQDGATKAFGNNYDKIVTTVRTKEDSRR